MAALPPGAVVGRYSVVELLHDGGLTRTYAAQDVAGGQRVALKVLDPDVAKKRAASARFFADARAVRRISHDHIARILELVEQPGSHNYYVMELLSGEHLGQRVARGALQVRRALEIAIAAADALAAAHRAGILHRDLRPQSVFLHKSADGTEVVKLIDFGPKLADSDIQTTAAGQRSAYASPEQLGGQKVDFRTDVYALGVILYEMITGSVPFPGTRRGKDLPKPPSTFRLAIEVPTALDELVLELVAADPDERPHSMSAVEGRLREILAELAPPEPTSRPPSKRAARVEPMATATAEDVQRATPTAARSSPPMGLAAMPMRAAPPPMPPERRTARASSPPPVTDELRPVSGEIAPRTPTPPPPVAPAEVVVSVLPAPVAAAIADVEGELQVRRVGDDTAQILILPERRSGGLIVLTAIIAIAGGGAGVWYLLRDRSGGDVAAAPAATPAQPALPPAPTPAPAPAPTPVAEPAPAVAPEPATVRIRFTSTPPGAEVRVEGEDELLGTTPFTRSLPRDTGTRTFEFTKSGYTTAREEIALDVDSALAAALTEVEVAPPPAANPPPKKGRVTRPAGKPPKPDKPKADGSLDRGATMDVFDEGAK